jgi:hypothetical protein
MLSKIRTGILGLKANLVSIEPNRKEMLEITGSVPAAIRGVIAITRPSVPILLISDLQAVI